MDVTSVRDRDVDVNNPVVEAIIQFLYAIRGSFSVALFVGGILTAILGLVLNNGVMAGMLVIWGASAMGYAILLKVFLKIFMFT